MEQENIQYAPHPLLLFVIFIIQYIFGKSILLYRYHPYVPFAGLKIQCLYLFNHNISRTQYISNSNLCPTFCSDTKTVRPLSLKQTIEYTHSYFCSTFCSDIGTQRSLSLKQTSEHFLSTAFLPFTCSCFVSATVKCIRNQYTNVSHGYPLAWVKI